MIARSPDMRRAVLLAVFVGFAGVATRAAAHPVRASAVDLDLRDDSVGVELGMPLDQLGMALERPIDDPAALLPAHTAELRAYLGEHVGAVTPAGEPFALSVGALAVRRIDDADHLVAQLELDPPAGATTRSFTLRCDPILHRVVSHKLFVSIRRDFATAVFADEPVPVGILRYQHDTLAIDRPDGGFWRGVRAICMHGVRHIADGSDHLLFILVLLLPAPLLARGGRWRAEGSLRRGVVGILKIVTAFTLGHSVTLALAVLGLLRLPTAPVEIFVALSIAGSAVHAVRPLFPGREPLVAACFGLVHGLAFATALTDLGYGGRTLLASLLAFNLGIEVMQLAVVAAVMPWLVLLRRAPVYTPLRWTAAGFAGLAAVGWISERACATGNFMQPIVDAVFGHGAAVVATLAALALIVTGLRRR